MKRGLEGHQRKRPHILPPLSTLQGHTPGPMDPLQPPNIFTLEGRLGSPTPRWHRPTAEELEMFQENATEARPGIKVTPCLDQDGNPTREKRRESLMSLDLRSDPIFKEDNDLLYTVQRRNSIKTLGLDKPRMNMKNARIDEERKRKEDKKGYILPEKALHLPSRYAPLKPITKKINQEKET